MEQRGAITVKELAEEMGVSAVTLRQDVRELADRGLLARVHGGARALAGAPAAGGGPAAGAPAARVAPVQEPAAAAP
ncbi:DeoR family transcriptional regulator, partial [Kitasatospora cineracea]|uniref:DeoR family transcriptional regulator n=1 Tax=Kitasatospora cineracea TaxID=88074 RepID=UPI0036DA258C